MIEFEHKTSPTNFDFSHRSSPMLVSFLQTTIPAVFRFGHEVFVASVFTEGIGYWVIEDNFEVQ